MPPDSASALEPAADRPVLPRVVRLAAYGVIVRDGCLLLCRIAPAFPDAGALTLPGGGLDFGEPPEAGAIREVAEETGLIAAISGPPTIWSDTGIWERRSGAVLYHTIRFAYPMRVIGGEERVEVDGSTDGFEWVPLGEVARRGVVEIVERILAGLEAGG